MTGEGQQKINAEEMFRSLNGFEEISVNQHFRQSAGVLAHNAEEGDVFPLMRALLFIESKRDGMNETDAFRNVMHMRADEVAERFTAEEVNAEGEA